jgi:hypothetical protein
MRNYQIDAPSNRLTFTDLRFYYDNEAPGWFPSSTTVLEAYPKTAQFYEWLKANGDQADTIRDDAGRDGSAVHGLTEAYDNGDTVSCITADGEVRYSTRVWAMFERYVDFVRRFNPEIIENEFSTVDAELGYGGTIDRIIDLDGRRLVLDIKTSGSIHDHYWLQTTSYLKLYEKKRGVKLDGTCILWLNAKTRTEGKKGAIQGIGWQLIFPDQTIDHYWGLFQHTKALWDEINKDYKPRNLTYSLSHSKIKQWD